MAIGRTRLVACALILACLAGVADASAQVDLPPGDDAVVTRVVDGDTIQVRLKGRTYIVRYIGVDAPESTRQKDCYGSEASAYNRSLVMPKGKGVTVRLEMDVSETDRFGRLLRYVYLADGTMVNEALVANGFAQVSTYPPDVKHQERFIAAQRIARDAASGLWGKCAAQSSPAPASVPAPCNCAGPDLDCKDFKTQASAQACWDACGGKAGGHNPFRLDGTDKDGRVCEALP